MLKKGSKQFTKEYFLILLPLFFVLHGFLRYPEAIYWIDVVILFGLYAGCSLLLAFLLKLIFSSFRKAALYAFTLMSFNFLFGNGHDAAKLFLQNTFITRYAFLVPLIVVLFALLFFLLYKTKRTFPRLTRYLNLLFVLLICIDLVSFVIKKTGRTEALQKELSPCTNCPKPDIYLLVVDGYGGRRQLLQNFNLDNAAFEDLLRQKGFYVVDSSISNYSATNRSMSSLLNMKYLADAASDDFHQEFAIILSLPI